MTLELTSAPAGAVQIVAVTGRLDNLTAGEFDKEFPAVVTSVVLDLTRVDYISSAGLRCVLGALKRVKAAGGRMALAADQAQVLEVLEISGFRSLMEIHADRDAAVAALS